MPIWRVRPSLYLTSSTYITITRFSPHIYRSKYPRHLLDSIGAITFVKSSKYFLGLKLYMFYCAYCWIGRTLRERIVYPCKLHDRWQEEYDAFQTSSERVDWVLQKNEERTAINAVRDVEEFENGSNPLLFSSMPNFANNGQSLWNRLKRWRRWH